ncbi:MAG: lysine--tRNA ligase [Nanoarchaeota archaeon]|nr:lysine--tRNA ligase [Nanoarchaeota archaeon]MBU1028397.1 lysine--tRNA ligase [Nanoarchaeota archaeon]
MVEKFYWADEIADQIIKKNPNKKQYVCASGITPSGTVHIGNFREVITTELVVRALKDKKKKARFIYSWDDYDRFRKIPEWLSKDYEKYIGMPVSEIPSPFDKNKSYARYFEEKFENSLSEVGIKADFVQQNIMNKKCKYSKLIKIGLDKRKEIMNILNKYRKEPLAKDWVPIVIYCEKCKKDFTKIISIKNYEIEYECVCGHKDKFDYRKKGLVSVKWRVDWPMRWKYEGVNFEPGGIDHSVQGGSFTTAKEISKQIFDWPAPVYVFYDWIKLKGGKEFASSTGNDITPKQVGEVYEPEVLRYLFVSQKPKTGFQISFDNDVIKIYEDYDALEKKYCEKKVNPREKRIYELSQVDKPKKKIVKKTSFRHLITLIQTNKKIPLNDKIRAEKVKNWLEKYAREDMKFEVQTKINVKLEKKEKLALLKLKNILKAGEHSEEELFNMFYEICKDVGISNTQFFQAVYRVIINKEKGPRLANLILTIGKDKIIKLLEQMK